jgi:hypothetical protein
LPTKNNLAENPDDNQPKDAPPTNSEELSTYRKHSMDYFTKDGVTLRTGFSNIRNWFLLCIRELMDNGIDFLIRHYKGADNTIITVEIFKDDTLFHLKVKNSNNSNFDVFKNKAAIFDYEQRYGSKQDLHVVSRGMLGDAMKQILAFGHILMHFDNDGRTSFQDKHWNRPLVIRHNKKEYRLYLKVNKSKQTAFTKIEKISSKLTDPSTEIEFTLPIPTEVQSGNGLTRLHIEEFCKKYPLLTTDISFKFEITDNSPPVHLPSESKDETISNPEETIAQSVLNAFSSESPRATIKIEYDALHPISTESWSKQNSVYSYTPEEFKRRFVNIDPVQAANTTVYNILQSYREGTNLGRTSEHEISVTELLNLPERKCSQKIQSFYRQLKTALSPPEKLILPYSNNKGERKNALVTRLNFLYPNLDKDRNKAAYKAIHAKYTNEIVSYPYFFEILAIPFADPITTKHNIEFIGAVNYSISPKQNSNLFEGDYRHYIIDQDPYSPTKDILGVLEAFGFHSYAHETVKIPCLIIANLVTPRRDPHGQDKSRIDITPFAGTIVDAVRRLASDIKTYRALGIHFSSPKERANAEYFPSGRGQLEGLLTKYLRENHGL